MSSRRAVLSLTVMTLVLAGMALASCGGGGSEQEEAKARPLPETPQELRPGEYRSEAFKPSVSFHVGTGWATSKPETSDYLELQWGEQGGLAFTNVQKVSKPIYKPTETNTPKLVEAPEDLVGWFQNHPYLKTSKPEPVTVGGVKGQQFDAAAEDLPEDYLSVCGADCVDTITGPTAEIIFYEGNKAHATILEDVKGETVYIDYGALATDFDKIAPEAQKVVESVKWGGS